MIVRKLFVILAGALLVALGSTAPAAAANVDMLPAGSTACTDRVHSSAGAFIRGRADNVPATFTMRMASTAAGPETTIFTQVAREVQIQVPGNDYPTYRVLVQPPSPGTYYFRACVTASHGSDYRFKLAADINGPGQSDVGPHEAVLGPGGRHCGDWLAGPASGLGNGLARLTGTSTVPVAFSLNAFDADYGHLGDIFARTGTAVDEVYVSGAHISSLSACVINTSASFATVSFELSQA
jgi:hypothetical protein